MSEGQCGSGWRAAGRAVGNGHRMRGVMKVTKALARMTAPALKKCV